MFLCNFQTVAYTAESWWKCKSHSAAICVCGRLVISFTYLSKYLLVMFLTLVSSHQQNNLKMFGNPANHLATSPVRLLKITRYKLDVQSSWVKQSIKMHQKNSTLNNIIWNIALAEIIGKTAEYPLHGTIPIVRKARGHISNTDK